MRLCRSSARSALRTTDTAGRSRHSSLRRVTFAVIISTKRPPHRHLSSITLYTLCRCSS